MEKYNKLVPLAKKCEAANEVTDEQWEQAQVHFENLGSFWSCDLTEELAAFKNIMEAYDNRCVGYL